MEAGPHPIFEHASPLGIQAPGADRAPHIDDWEIVDDLRPRIPEIGFVPSKPLFLYDLGPAIMPAEEVRTGKVYRNGRVWAMLDLLLTSPTVSEARDRTKQRLEAGSSSD